MSISFETPIRGALAPHHYIEFSPAPAMDGLVAMEQTLLLICFKSGSNNFPIGEVLSFLEAKQKYTLPKELEESSQAALRCAPMIKIKLLQLEGSENLEQVLPEVSFTQIALLNLNEDMIKKFADEFERRWSQNVQLDGHIFVALRNEFEKMESFAKSLNSNQVTIIPVLDGDASLPVWAASFAAINAVYAVDPSRPYQNIKVLGLYEKSGGYKLSERNALLTAGISTWKKVGSDIYLDRIVTTQTRNAQGEPDASFRDLNTKQVLSLIRYDFRAAISSAFSRHMLAKDDFPYEGAVVTKKVARAFAIACFRKWQAKNLVQDPGNEFAKNVVVEIDDEPGKLNFMLPLHIMGAWRMTHTQIAFRS